MAATAAITTRGATRLMSVQTTPTTTTTTTPTPTPTPTPTQQKSARQVISQGLMRSSPIIRSMPIPLLPMKLFHRPAGRRPLRHQ
jgi:hypothetical protein